MHDSPTPGPPRAGASHPVALLAVLLLALAALLPARAEKGVNDGSFRDRDGKVHPWRLEESHLLVWDGQPYAPAGVIFRSAYLKSPSPETLKQDFAELDRLRAAGVQDIWIDPQRGLLENSPAETQALLDGVESRGFRYGLRVGDRHRDPLIGYSPTLPPVRVPVAQMQPRARNEWRVRAPDGRRVAYVLAEVGSRAENDDRVHYWAVATGEAVVERDVATIQVQLPASKLLGANRGLLLVASEIQVPAEELGSFGDLWAGMEAYAARLEKYLRALHFGAGFRFLLDPFAAGDGTLGREDQVFPTSDAFRRGFREWLQRRGGIHTLNTRWRTTDRRIPGFEEASRIIPMWSRTDPPEGDGWLYDPVEGVAYRCKPRDSTIWDDLAEFRTDTLKRWMNLVASSLKQGGLDVPVLFSWSAYHPIFVNRPSPTGYDGLGAQIEVDSGAAADGDREDWIREASYALGQVEEASRRSWLVATRLVGRQPESGAPAPLGDSARVRQIWQGLREAGFRGVYFDPAVHPNAPALAKEIAGAMAAESAALAERPRICFFPIPLATAERPVRLAGGVWWVPSSAPAQLLRYGDTLIGYEIERPFGDAHPIEKGTVVWSLSGKQEFSFYLDPVQTPQWFDLAGQPLKVRLRKREKRMTVTIGEEPVVATGVDALNLFPLELASERLREMESLLKEAEKRQLDTTALRILYRQAREALASGNAPAIYSSITPHVMRLREVLRPYLWIEGERSSSHNFNGIVFQAGCSGGSYLRLDRGAPPVTGVYRARYLFEVRIDTSYEIWVAGRLPGRAGVSPLIWQIDEEPAIELKAPQAVGGEYSRGMTWFQLGRVTLSIGRHELTLVVPEKAAGEGGRFVAGIDAIVLSREPFSPQDLKRQK